MQHEMWKLLCISLSMAVSKIEHSGNGKFNTNCGACCARCCICVFNSSELMVVEMQHEMWKQLCISLSMAVSKIEHSGNGNSTRVVEGVVDACCLSRCICCFQCRLCLLVEKSLVNGSCRNRGMNCVICCRCCCACWLENDQKQLVVSVVNV